MGFFEQHQDDPEYVKREAERADPLIQRSAGICRYVVSELRKTKRQPEAIAQRNKWAVAMQCGAQIVHDEAGPLVDCQADSCALQKLQSTSEQSFDFSQRITRPHHPQIPPDFIGTT